MFKSGKKWQENYSSEKAKDYKNSTKLGSEKLRDLVERAYTFKKNREVSKPVVNTIVPRKKISPQQQQQQQNSYFVDVKPVRKTFVIADATRKKGTMTIVPRTRSLNTRQSKGKANKDAKLLSEPNLLPLKTRIGHQLRLAVHEGGSTNPNQNAKLRRAIKKAIEHNVSEDQISQVLRKCELPEINFNTFLLQIRYQRKVYLICTVHTHNLYELQRLMAPILRKHGSAFAYVMHLFRNGAMIEALISYQTDVDFSDLEGHIARDAEMVKARSVEVVDYETGAVQFKCDPMQLTDVCRGIESRGYRILHTEFAFSAKNPIKLNWYEREGYERFLRRLQKISEVESIYDNVQNMNDDDD